MSDAIHHQKQQMRREACLLRDRQLDIKKLSHRIFAHLETLPTYQNASSVMIYLDIRSEVRTHWFLPRLWQNGKKVAVPYCTHEQLMPFWLENADELCPGMFGILEPRPELRSIPERQVTPGTLDIIIIPGVAFDHRGNRLGYGKGYYDEFLQRFGGNPTKLAVCFECQLFPHVPALPHDVRMDWILTENQLHEPPPP
jgi:5-formyltetrahydrofolate cyclo-ligase